MTQVIVAKDHNHPTRWSITADGPDGIRLDAVYVDVAYPPTKAGVKLLRAVVVLRLGLPRGVWTVTDAGVHIWVPRG